LLNFTIASSDILKFSTVEKDVGGELFEVEPKLLSITTNSTVEIPGQVDLSNRFNVVILAAGESIQDSMNGFLIGSFVFNAVISISMKKLLQTIKVIQLISFMVVMLISFRPVCKLFL
jgi:hypothetical protein